MTTDKSVDLIVIDADTLLYQAAWAATTEGVVYQSGETAETVINEDAAKGILEETTDLWLSYVDHFCGVEPGVDTLFVRSMSGRTTFRHLLYPPYKANRKPKPDVFPVVEKHFRFLYDDRTHDLPGLEADDAVSMIGHNNPRCVMVSVDKDLLQIPGMHIIPKDTVENSVFEKVDERRARHLMWTQVLTGDNTDNYLGAPGVGPKKAMKVLEGLYGKPDTKYASAVRVAFKEQFQNERWRDKFFTNSHDHEMAISIMCARLLHPAEYSLDIETGSVSVDVSFGSRHSGYVFTEGDWVLPGGFQYRYSLGDPDVE